MTPNHRYYKLKLEGICTITYTILGYPYLLRFLTLRSEHTLM
jgi:hypothetical protein